MIMTRSELTYLVRLTKARQARFNDMSLYNLYQTKVGLSERLSLSGPFLGAPHAVIGMEKLIALGAKRIWVLGWCGSLQHNVRIGHLIIPTGAVSEEGTSNHYPIGKGALQSDATLNQTLEQALKQKGLPYSKGHVWTTDAIYRETPEKVSAYQAQGVLAVEMEISALMTLALYRSVAMAGLLVVSDELFDLTWQQGFSNPLLKKTSRAAGKLLFNLAASFTKNAAPEPESAISS
jgi:uridine phosphorylase